MPLYEAVPDGTARGAVVVVQEAFGVNDHIEDVTRRFADGRLPRRGAPPVPPHRVPGLRLRGLHASSSPTSLALSDDGLLADVRAALDHLRAAGWADRQIGIVGFCMGGRVTFLVAGHEALGAAVGFYGGGMVTGRTEAHARAPRPGARHAHAVARPVRRRRRLHPGGGRGAPPRTHSTPAADVDTPIVRYPDAQHGFHCDVRDSYDEAAATDAWRRTLAWLDDHLAAPG